MAETINLALDVIDGADGPRLTRVCLEMACSYTKGQGAPTLTADCDSLDDFEREIVRLKEECDELLKRARNAFGDELEGGSPGIEAEETVSPITSKARQPANKLALRIRDDLRVEDEMTRDVKTMHRNDHLSVSDELMKIGGFRHVVVVEDESDEVVGVVSHRDIFYGALAWSTGQGDAAHHRMLDAFPAKQVMCADVTTVAPDAPLVDAARIMSEKKLGCLPVVRNERLVGILTEGDFLSLLTNAERDEAGSSERVPS
jgi:CBS domain-containing protein